MRTRMERFTDAGAEPKLPPITCGGYLVEALFDMGPVVSGGMGIAALDYTHIAAYERANGIEFSPWESQAIRRLSIVYANESHAAATENAPAPWTPPSEPQERRVVGDSLRDSIRAMARRGAPK